MKTPRSILATAIVVATLCMSFQAKASWIDLDTIGASSADKTVVTDEYYPRKPPLDKVPYIYNYLLTGILDAYTQITFTFTATNVGNAGLVSGSLEAFSYGDLLKDIKSSISTIHLFDKSTWPTLTVSNGDTLMETVVITNNTGSAMNFVAYFLALIYAGCGCGDLTIGYTVASVPLPASALLFGSALLLLAAYAARKRTSDVF